MSWPRNMTSHFQTPFWNQHLTVSADNREMSLKYLIPQDKEAVRDSQGSVTRACTVYASQRKNEKMSTSWAESLHLVPGLQKV